jgi:DNA-binding LacI/PurR family transcriptional regulator
VSATDSEAARWAHPSLSVINLHPDKIGQQAADMLIALVEGGELAEPHVTVPSRVVPRASTRRRSVAAAQRTR